MNKKNSDFKILIINPNSNKDMSKSILEAAEKFVQGEYQVSCLTTPDAPEFIDTYEDQIRSAPGMLKLLRENEVEFDAFIVACHCDPNLDLLKEITFKPVVGIGEASMKLASMLGHRFSVISTAEHSIPNKEVLVRKYHLEGVIASVRAPSPEMRHLAKEQNYLETARRAVDEDGAEVLVLGCAGMAGMDKLIQSELGVPVLDGVICALILASGLVKYQVSTSKKRRYNPHY